MSIKRNREARNLILRPVSEERKKELRKDLAFRIIYSTIYKYTDWKHEDEVWSQAEADYEFMLLKNSEAEKDTNDSPHNTNRSK